jgi:hypothetical protein
MRPAPPFRQTADAPCGRAPRVTRAVIRVLGFAALFAVSLVISAAAGFSLDETWFLQVVTRVVHGETLYRDVFFLSTPLSVQATALAARIFGTGLIVEKAVTSLAFVAELGFADALLGACRVGRRPRLIAWLALFVYTQHFPNPPYRAMGSALMLGAFWALVVWLGRVETRHASPMRWLALTGLFAGASFSAMPNHGLLALGSAGVVIVTSCRTRGRSTGEALRALAVLAAGFVIVVAVSLAPVAVSASWTELLDYTIRNKGSYVRAGGASIVTELRTLVAISPFDPAALGRLYRGFAVVLTPVAIAAALAAFAGATGKRRPLAMAVLLLVVSGIAGAYPRMNRFHLSYASPALIVGLAFSWMTLSEGIRLPRRLVSLAVTACLVPGLVLTLAGAVRALVTDQRVWSAIAHFEGIRVSRAEEAEIQQRAARMREQLGQRPLLIGTHASLYYLATGARNPTPFDESSVMSFGPRGQQQAIAGLSAGQFGPVCLEPLDGPLRPAALIAYVRGSMRAAGDLGVCVVYR